MKNLSSNYFNPFFSHIYVEQRVRNHPRTRQILKRYPKAAVITIGHYKDVFCRGRQDLALQRRSQKLILAARDENFVYPGAAVCQDFGNAHFYYTSCMMNCLYDCAYCYLKGMYPSANLVIFVNLEDYFAQVERMLASQPLYLCVSYDTDLLAAESIAGYASAWSRFAARHPERLKIEIRTKGAARHFFEHQEPLSHVIYAFTLSPQAVIECFEHHTPSFKARLDQAAAAVRAGFSVRLCFDPMIYVHEWQRHYDTMLEQVFETIAPQQLADVSVGSFRIPRDYLKKMRRQQPGSAAAWFPYELENGYYHYPTHLLKQMERYLVSRLQERLPEEKIFVWTHPS